MYHANGAQADTTEQRKPPTLAGIVREKTGDGARIIDFFLDVMEGRVDGAELCHKIDAAKQLEMHRSEAAAGFLARYRGLSCGHSTRGRPAPANPCPDVERGLVPVTLNAPPTLTRDFLTVLSAVDEDLMTRLVRAQTADGGTVIDFLYDVMQDSVEGFKCRHRLAAAKELIAHIVRDEQPSHTPSPSTGDRQGDEAVVGADPRVRPLPVSHPSSTSTEEGREPALILSKGKGDSNVVPEKSGTHPSSTSTEEADRHGDEAVVGADPRVRPLPGSHPSPPSTEEGREPALILSKGKGDSNVVPAQAGTHPPDRRLHAPRPLTSLVAATRPHN